MRKQKHYEPGEVYRRSALQGADTRDPVIVIPGILGSQLGEAETGRLVWGGLKHEFAKQDTPEELRLIAHPMGLGRSLGELTPPTSAVGITRRLQLRTPTVSMCVGTYATILEMLGVGGYVRSDEKRRKTGLEYGVGSISTCFEFAYDWRRSLDDNAVELASFVDRVAAFVAQERGCSAAEVKIDFVAHSMGGLLLRYYMRYGGQPLEEDGSAPALTWEGAKRTKHGIFIGTPNAGALGAVSVLTEGLRKHPVFPSYDKWVLGTLPGVYQLMPRARQARVRIGDDASVLDGLFDAEAWIEHGIGLASEDSDDRLAVLLPEVSDAGDRRVIAVDHLRKCLERAEAVHRAIDAPTERPPGGSYTLFAGDRYRTARVGCVTPGTGAYRTVDVGPGDATVLRSSALADERMDDDPSPRVRSPLDWDGVVFLPTNHLNLTKDRTFLDSALWVLLEKPTRDGRS